MLLRLLGAEASAVLLLLTVELPAWLVDYPKALQHRLLGPANPSLVALVASPKGLQGQGGSRSVGMGSWARVGKLCGTDPCPSLYASKADMH